MEKETANAEIRKGKMVTPSRLEIDTEPKAAPRIIEEKEMPAVKYPKMPQISPPHQQNARNKRPFLRCRWSCAEVNSRARKNTPSSIFNADQSLMETVGVCTAREESYQNFNTPILYSKIYKNSSFFSQNSVFCRL